MSTEAWRRLQELFAELADASPDTRRRRLDAIGAEDPELRHELDELLLHDQTPDELSAMVGRVASDAVGDTPGSTEAADHLIGTRVDGYTLDAVLGEGGFGVVYRARQAEPVAREVALKVIRRGLDSVGVARRFELERQALAAMHHPAIAQVFDAGTTEDGRP
ncbi:MAG: serine/threonine protein kinase, partial [Acidobacteriota bacterium]